MCGLGLRTGWVEGRGAGKFKVKRANSDFNFNFKFEIRRSELCGKHANLLFHKYIGSRVRCAFVVRQVIRGRWRKKSKLPIALFE